MELFSQHDNPKHDNSARLKFSPLAERVRPRSLEEFAGQHHLLGEGKSLRLLIEGDEVPSMIFWGPPGSGKTTLARIIANMTHAEFFQLNAVSSGVKDVREVIERAGKVRKLHNRRTILFIDEIHRFNKAQQDALLHSVEEGIITLIGATTENPSFEVIGPLLSRCRIYLLEPLGNEELTSILDDALTRDEQLKHSNISIAMPEREYLMAFSAGDARMMLNGLEVAARLARSGKTGARIISKQILEEAFQRKHAKYDKGGEEHYNIISAFIKSMRGGDPDAAVYWMARMLDGGEDPKFIARRMIILASEDIGNADPQALTLSTSCFTAVDYVGMPEARIILSQCAAYLASAPKSNAAVMAITQAMEDVRTKPNLSVPLHLRNAPTKLMTELGYGKEYRYSHDYPDNFIDQQYLPDNLKSVLYYNPTDHGEEKAIRERLNSWWKKKPR